MTENRKVKREIGDMIARSQDWPPGFESGRMRRWRKSHHVLTVNCSQCGHVVAYFMAPVAATTAPEVAATGQFVSALPILGDSGRSTCECAPGLESWGLSSDAYLPAIRRAIKDGLGTIADRCSVRVVLSPPSKLG